MDAGSSSFVHHRDDFAEAGLNGHGEVHGAVFAVAIAQFLQEPVHRSYVSAIAVHQGFMPVDERAPETRPQVIPIHKAIRRDLSYGRLASGRTRTNNIGLPPKSEFTNLPLLVMTGLGLFLRNALRRLLRGAGSGGCG
jgi:hypothetical protein